MDKRHDIQWPAITFEEVPWERAERGGISRRAALKARGPYQAAVPPRIASVPAPTLDPETAALAEEAVGQLGRFDGELGAITAPFIAILLRSESSASSEIEHLTASAKNIAVAELGRPAGPNSRLIVGNVRAMEAAISMADHLDTASIIAMHQEILVDQPEHTGDWRSRPVWIDGGYSRSPHTASFVPPRHTRVSDLMDDLVEFVHRTDLPALTQIAIAHAQFETVHPFPDGNGRTGRALIQAMLRGLGITQHVTVPVSAGLLRDPSGYFGALTAYRDGSIAPIVRTVAEASFDAIANGRELATDLIGIRAEWEATTSARSGSAGRRLLDILQRSPVIDADHAARELGLSARNVQNGIDRLVDDGILHKIGGATRGRLYEARDVLAALDAFAARSRRRR